jgi:hypothetical protein
MTDYFTQANIIAHGPGCPAGCLPTALITLEEIELLDQFGISIDATDDGDYLVAHDDFLTIADTDDGEVQLDDVLQAIIKRSDGQVTHITISAAQTASKPRPDAYGGFAEVITADGVQYISLYEWIQQQLTPGGRAAQARRDLEGQGYTVVAPNQPVFVILKLEALSVQDVLLFTDIDVAQPLYDRLRAEILQIAVEDLDEYEWHLLIENPRIRGGNLVEWHPTIFYVPPPVDDELPD